jgi:tetratricopeptide (TPR) repeat protein
VNAINTAKGVLRRRHFHWALFALSLLPAPVLGQANPHTLLHDALVLENRGSFEAAAKAAKLAIDSGQLSGVELGRAYIIFGVACEGEGNLIDTQLAFEHSLRILEKDPGHVEDYASALENYAGFYSDLGQLEIAGRMWLKAFHLRQQVGDHAGLMLSLTHLAQLALARNKVRQACEYLRQASDELKLAHDLVDEDMAVLSETQGWLALTEHHASEAIAAYQHTLELLERSRGHEHWLTGWEHMLRGKAYAQAGDLNRASADMRSGLAILGQTVGKENPRYFVAQIAYAQVLDRMGSHAEAAEMRAMAEKARKDYHGSQCTSCTISVAAFR